MGAIERFQLRMLTAATLVALWPCAAAAADVIVHRPFADLEDGVAPYDADGSRNGVVRWAAGKTHVVADDYFVQGPYDAQNNTQTGIRLEIDGATVKIAGYCELQGDEIVSCLPPEPCCGSILANSLSTIRITSSTITDIRDDSIGGDTDKAAATPSSSYVISFGGTPGEALLSSNIRYAGMVGHFGSIDIKDNTFVDCGGLGSHFGSLNFEVAAVPGAAPTISGNTFEIRSATSGPAALDVRGMCPVIFDNTFTGTGAGVRIGPAWGEPYGSTDAIPKTGKTVIRGNRFRTSTGIEFFPPVQGGRILELARFRAEIAANDFEAPDGNVGVGMGLPMAASIVVSANRVKGYYRPLLLSPSGADFSDERALGLVDLRINDNRFSLEGAVLGPEVPETIWSKQFRVDAERNYWGHATGPHDASNADSVANPNGQGLPVSNGIDYVPFVGGSTPPPVDSIRIEATSTPAAPLPPDVTASVDVNVTQFDLRSASSGQIIVVLRDANGEILNQPGQIVDVNSAMHSADVPTIDVNVPKLTTAIFAEAMLAPANGEEPVHSNVVSIGVIPVEGSLRLECVGDANDDSTCVPIFFLRGETAVARFRFRYTSAVPVHGQLAIQEREMGTGAVLHDFPLQVFDCPMGGCPAGIRRTADSIVELDLPLRNALDLPTLAAVAPSQLVAEFVTKDEDGNVVAVGGATLPVLDSANRISVVSHLPIDQGSFSVRGTPGFFLVGERAVFLSQLSTAVGTRYVTNWEVFVDPAIVLDATGAQVLRYNTQVGARDTGISTGIHQTPQLLSKIPASSPVLPANGRTMRQYYRLVAPTEGVTVAYKVADVPVREAEQFAQLDVAAGASVVTFTSVPVSLAFQSNAAAGKVSVAEFGGDPAATPATADLAASAAHVPAIVTEQGKELIPLLRYWSVYDNLVDGSFQAKVTFAYDPDTDFPDNPRFDENALVITGMNPYSGDLEVLDTALDTSAHTVTTSYVDFYTTYVVVSAVDAATLCGDPNGDGKTKAGDALYTLRAAVGSASCEQCICDVNSSGRITAADALVVLKAAVGLPVSLDCPACG